MQTPGGGVRIQSIAILKPSQPSSEIVALYFDSDDKYIFAMFENGVFQYFKYNPNASSWNVSVNNLKLFQAKQFKNLASIILWHFNYDTKTMTFIDSDYVVRDIKANKDLETSQNTVLKATLSLGQKQYFQMVGFKEYLAVSNFKEPENQGQIILLKDGQVISELEGTEGQSLGEYLLLSQDAPGGNLVLGASQRSARDSLDHIALYKLLQNDDGAQDLFKMSDQALSTTITPKQGSVNELKAGKQKSLSVSFSYGSLITTTNGASEQVRVCKETEFFADDQCQPCEEDQGASSIQSGSCIACDELW